MSGRRQSDHHSHSSSHHNNRENSSHDSSRDRKFKNTEDQCSLQIENIADPETYKDFERQVKQYGMTTKFWINKRSRTCVVTYCQQEDAIQAFSKLSKIYWPDQGGEKLKVKLLQNIEVSDIITKIQVSQNITRPEQEAFKDKNRRDDYDRKDKKRYSSDRDSRERDRDNRDRERDQRDKRDRERDRSEKDRDRDERYDDKYRKRSPNKYQDDRYEQKDRYQYQRISSNFLKTNYQPSVYYTIQPKEIVQKRQDMIGKLYENNKK
ncbi:hypothetical protein ABPG74_016802 [Tetrahymena malaccensis]